MKLKFADLKKIPRGKELPADANAIARIAVEKLRDPDALELLREAEVNKWHGSLIYPIDDNPRLEIKFRRGVFQFMTINVLKGKTLFRMTVINDNVEFGKDKEDGHPEDK